MVAPSDQTVIAPSNVKWRCVVRANPPATIVWRKDGKRIAEGSNVDVVETDDGSELMLANVSRQNAGEYECRAKNSVGKSSATATLEVYGELERLAVFDIYIV